MKRVSALVLIASSFLIVNASAADKKTVPKKERSVASAGSSRCYRNDPENDFTEDFGDERPAGKIIGPVTIESVTAGLTTSAIGARDAKTSKSLDLMFAESNLATNAALFALTNKSVVYLYVKPGADALVVAVEFCK